MENAPPSLEERMIRARKGDGRAYESLIRDLVPLLEAFIRPKLSRQEECDDIIQETLISIHRAGHTWQEDRPLKPWVYAIADKRFKDHLRKHYRHRAEEPHEHDVIDRKSANQAAGDVTSDMNLSEYVEEALAELPEKQKTAVTMMKLEGYSARDVADKLETSEGAVKVMVHRAYKQLEALVQTKMRRDE